MKRAAHIMLAVLVGISILGCGKKNVSPVESQEAMSLEALNALSANMTMTPGETKPLPVASVATATPQTKSEAMSATAALKPTSEDMQVALKNAGFYTGNIDGKIGPMSKKAIEAFQKANGLTADGKVGSKTWSLLSKYLNAAPTTNIVPQR